MFVKLGSNCVKIGTYGFSHFSREMGHNFSHLARNQKREKCAGLVSELVEISKVVKKVRKLTGFLAQPRSIIIDGLAS